MPNPTIEDVARLARVSTATVSNVINGTSFVSAPLRARVQEAVAQLGFAPSRVAQGLRMQSTRLIGVVVADITNPFFSELVRRIGSIANWLGYNVLLCEADHDPAKELSALRLLAAHRVKDVVLAPTVPRPCISNRPFQTSSPLVMIDHVVPKSRFDGVSIDDRQAALDVTRHVLSLGHDHIAAIAGWRHLSNTTERLMASRPPWRSSARPSGSSVIYADFRQDRARELLEMSSSRLDVRLPFCFKRRDGDRGRAGHSGLGLACSLTSLWPASMLSLGDHICAAFRPRLDGQSRRWPNMASRVLHARIRGDGGPPQRIILEARLIVRDSCAPPEDRGKKRP